MIEENSFGLSLDMYNNIEPQAALHYPQPMDTFFSQVRLILTKHLQSDSMLNNGNIPLSPLLAFSRLDHITQETERDTQLWLDKTYEGKFIVSMDYTPPSAFVVALDIAPGVPRYSILIH